MTDMERNLRQNLQKEMDDMLFSTIELSDSDKQKIRKKAGAEQSGRRRFVLPKAWLGGAAALVAAVVIVTGLPLLQDSATVPTPTDNSSGIVQPGNGGSTTELSQLITTPFGTVQEAKTAFGSGVLIPQVAPEGFELAEIVGVGMKDQPLRDLNFTYSSSDKTVTFSASRMPAVFPTEMFTQITVGGADGFIFEQAEYTELFWVVDGIQYGVSGPISGDEAMSVAESVES